MVLTAAAEVEPDQQLPIFSTFCVRELLLTLLSHFVLLLDQNLQLSVVYRVSILVFIQFFLFLAMRQIPTKI